MHSNWRGELEWKKMHVEFAGGSDRACKMFDATLTQYVGWYNDPSVNGLEGSIHSMLEADSDFLMGHVLKNGLDLLGTGRSPTLDLTMKSDIDTMITLSQKSPHTAMEKKHVEAIKQWAEGDRQAACDTWEAILIHQPLDMVALKFAHDAYFFLGLKDNIRDSVARIMPLWNQTIPLYGYLHGMLAFGLEETNMFDQAEYHARKGLELNPRDAWSTHAMCHVLEMRGRQDEGIRFLDDTAKDWKTCGMLACHNYWHWSLYHIEKGDYEEAMGIFTGEVKMRSTQSGAVLDMVDAASLLYRLNLQGVDVSDQWTDLVDICRPHLDDHQLVFNDVHMLMMCLGAKAKDLTNHLMASVRNYLKNGRGTDHAVMMEVGEKLCDAILAYDSGDFASAVSLLYPIRYNIVRIGGSNAQRDLFNQLLICAALQSTLWEHHVLARRLLAERKVQRENSPLTDRLIAQAMAIHENDTS